MINGNLLLNNPVKVEYKGKFFTLFQPKFIDYVKYASMEFETDEERVDYLYKFFDIDFKTILGIKSDFKELLTITKDIEFAKFCFSELVDKMHCLLMNYNPEKTDKDVQEIKTSGYIIKVVDIVKVLSKFCNFYKYTHNEVFEIPLNLFFDMYSKIDIVHAENDLRLIELYSIPSYLKTGKGADFVTELKKENKEKLNKVFEMQVIARSANEELDRIRNFFKNNEIGGFLKDE